MCLAVPGRVLEISDNELRMARVAFGSVVKEASLSLLPHAKPGDFVIVHAGLALEIIDEQSAQETLDAFAELEDVERRMGHT